MSIQEELKEIVEQANEKSRMEFPDVQKVEVTNPPETQINVELNDVSELLQSILSALKVEDKPVDLTGLESRLEGILSAVSKEMETKEDIDYSDILEAIKLSIPASLDLDDFFEKLEEMLEDKLDITDQFREALKGFHSSGWLPVVQAITDGTQLTQITEPLSAFGEVLVHEPTPVIQISNQYQLDPANRSDLETFTATGGSADNLGNLFRCQTGTSAGGYGVIRSKEAAIYRPGEGMSGLLTATFTTGVATSLQFAGLFSLTETVAFGYDGTNFGTIYSNNGAAEVQSIQVTGAASSGANCTVTLDSDAVVIALTVSDVQTNAEEIRAGLAADGTLSGKWRFEQVNDTVYAIAKSVGNKTGTMSFAAGSSGATATVTEKTAGVTKTDNHTAQSSWNVTTSPFPEFDPTNLNIYKVSYGYLGTANIDFSIYNPNTGRFVLVHRQKFTDNSSVTNLGSPDMKIGWTAASLGSTGTNLTVTGASAKISIEGQDIVTNNTYAADNSVTSVSTTLTNIITIKNRTIYGDRFNLGKIFPLDVSIDNDHNKGSIIELYVNATLGGTTNFQYENEFNSIALVDKAGTTVTGGTLVDAFTVPAAGDAEVDIKKLSLKLNPEDTITVAAKTISGSSTAITGALVWQEEK
jgi:hypothetical protein